MTKRITLISFLLFFCGSLAVLADGSELEGGIGLDYFEFSDGNFDIDTTAGGGGDTNENGKVNEDIFGRATSGSEIIKNLNPTGLKETQAVLTGLSIYKRAGQGYVLRCLEADAKELSYSIVSVLAVNCVSNRSLQGTDTVLSTENLPAGTYFVVVRKANQVQKVFKIIL